MIFQIAFRNVLRNRRRTALSLLMIAAAVAAIVVFKGFSHNILGRVEFVAVNNQFGHLQVAAKKAWEPSAKDNPKDRLIRLDDSVTGKLDKDWPEIEYRSGRLSFFGLVNTGDQSVSARAIGVDPSRETRLLKSFFVKAGRNLTPESKFEVLLPKGITDQIGVEVGSHLTLLAYTVEGSVNAIDAELVGIIQSGIAELDNSTFYIPLSLAQMLMDTDSIEREVILLKDPTAVPRILHDLNGALPADMRARSWSELAVYHIQISEYFDVQNMVIQCILMILALLAIGNVVGMSIAERTGEIGTVRAIGDSRQDVLRLFLVEGIVLGVLGGLLGCVLGWITIRLINLAEIPVTTPGASIAVPLAVDVLPWEFVKAFLVMSLTAVLATLIPAYRASKVEIVEALKRNI